MKKTLSELQHEREILIKRLEYLLSEENPEVLNLKNRIYNLDLAIEKEKENKSFGSFLGNMIGVN